MVPPYGKYTPSCDSPGLSHSVAMTFLSLGHPTTRREWMAGTPEKLHPFRLPGCLPSVHASGGLCSEASHHVCASWWDICMV